jgi:hypothetical protein
MSHELEDVMAKARPIPPQYTGIYKDHKLTIGEARPKIVEVLRELSANDAMLLTLDVSEDGR